MANAAGPSLSGAAVEPEVDLDHAVQDGPVQGEHDQDRVPEGVREPVNQAQCGGVRVIGVQGCPLQAENYL